MFDTSDNSLMVYIFGPKKSRPFTVCVHTMVGVGFVVGSLLCNPFLPQQKTTKDVCPSNSTSKQIVDDNEEWISPRMYGFSAIAWPYLIMAFWHFLTAIGNFLEKNIIAMNTQLTTHIFKGFIILGLSGKEMPRFKEPSENEESKLDIEPQTTFSDLKYWKTVLIMVYIYYMMTCGMEGFFQVCELILHH